jgi:hypothetical protein
MRGGVSISIGLKINNEFLQWLKDKGRMKSELTDVFVNDNGTIKSEKRMAQIYNVSPDDWKEFCEVTNREYEEYKIIYYN